MTNQNARVILGFFSTKPPSAAVEMIRPLASDVAVSGSGAGRYGRLRLPSETLVAAHALDGQACRIIEILRRSAGPGAIFAISEDAAQKPANAGEGPRARLRSSEQRFDSACRDLEEAVRLDHALTSAGEWLQQNAYLVRTQAAEVRRSLPREYPRWLDRSIRRDDFARISALADGLVRQTDCALTESAIARCLSEHPALSMREIWALPMMLRMSLIEALSEIAGAVNRSQQFRELAYLWANRLATAARQGTEQFELMLARLEAERHAAPRAPWPDPHFAVCLAEQLQDQESTLAPVDRWIEEHLQTTLPQLVKAQHAREAAQRLSAANAFGSLRLLTHLEFARIFESASVVEMELRRDPTGLYNASDADTRDQCRRVLAQVARHSGAEELDIARRVILLAGRSGNHVLYFLLSDGLSELEKESRTRIPLGTRMVRFVRRHAPVSYLAVNLGLSLCLLALVLLTASDAGVHSRSLLATLGLFAFFPASELAIQITNVLVICLLPPVKLPKLDFSEGIPAKNATLIVVPMLLIGVEGIRRELQKLEIRFLANRDENLVFALFSDFTDSPGPAAPGDDDLFAAAREGIDALNQRYGQRFVLFHRPREWSESEGLWIGRERKRGKLEELNALLCGEGGNGILRAGHLPAAIRYVITLDADTQLPPGTARRLIETIAHPLNRIQLDPLRRVRRSGYAIIQPRVSVALPEAMATRFTRIFVNAAGTDPYCKAVSDAQQDLFREAIFHGKAIYDVRAMRTVLKDRFPAETLLSHDLIEGAHAGAGLASDIEVFENLPLTYAGFSRRAHRWIRGDWQIAPWIFPRVPGNRGATIPNPLSAVNRWRIAENLRRSLMPAASMLLLLFGWFFTAAPAVWTLTILLAFSLPALAPLFERWAGRVSGAATRWDGAASELERVTVNLSFLPHQAWLSMDAIARAIHRLVISHRGLLEWETAEASTTLAHRHFNATLRQMIIVAVCAIGLAPMLELHRTLGAAFPFLLLWIASPALLVWLNQPGVAVRRLESKDHLYLRRQARRTWRYFDDLVGPENNWLPPDNSQLALNIEVAQRTSPTNIGLWLTSALAARDLGYMTVDELLSRTAATVETLERLELYEGHPLNWYDTRTLAPLAPRYVSTVDSGNLLASLWVFGQGIRDALRAPLFGAAAIHGLRDTVSIAGELTHDPSIAAPIRELQHLLHPHPEGHEAVVRLRFASAAAGLIDSTRGDAEGSYWLIKLSRQIEQWRLVAARYLGWMDTLARAPESFEQQFGAEASRLRGRALDSVPSLDELANGGAAMEALLKLQPPAGELAAWFERLEAEFRRARENAAATVAEYEALQKKVDHFAAGIDMRFLYDPARKLFGVGYAVGGPVEFKSHYDLLASECRLASLVAIAKGDVPADHWAALGRTRSPAPDGAMLLSWSGTMFEFLMPLLFLPDFHGSLLEAASCRAVEKQIEYGQTHAIPWGISESAYSALDLRKTYQYRAFGVPDLALNREFDPGPVVTPYATMLALMVAPARAIANLRRLEQLGLAGPMGFYESIDFSRARDRAGDRGIVIYTYMAHHQGMSLAALDNVLHHAVFQRRLHSVLRIRAFESLLYERVPIARQRENDSDRAVLVRGAAHAPARSAEIHLPPDRNHPCAHLNGNGRYTILLTRSGAGFSRWNGFDVTRWRSDTTLDDSGIRFFIRDLAGSDRWQVAGRSDKSNFSGDRAEFVRRISGIETALDATVSPDDDLELRRVAIANHSDRTRELELTSYLELALAPHRADAAHPAFSKLFIETEYAGDGVLIAHRRPRSPEEAPIWAAHVLLGAPGEIQFETDRARFLGRSRTIDNAAALSDALTRTAGAVLDPIFSLRFRVSLAPRSRVDVTFLTAAAASKETLLASIEKYRSRAAIARAFELAWIRAQLELRYLGLHCGAVQRFQELAGRLMYPAPSLRTSAARLSRNCLGQSSLWTYGISGDLPILAVTVSDSRDLALVRELLLAHAWWRNAGFLADLVILDQEIPSYDRPLHLQIEQQMQAHSAQRIDAPGGVFLRDWDALPAEHRDLILASATVALSGTRGSLEQQLSGAALPPPGGVEPRSIPQPVSNATGDFSAGGREYAVDLSAGATTPAPWVNVIANENFGAMVSESGLGVTWSRNSQTNRLTPWQNDPVIDPPSEVIYIRDNASGAVWSPTASPARDSEPYRVRHGAGYSIFEHASRGIAQELTVFVPPDQPLKVQILKLRNDSSERRSLSVFYFAEWVLGSVREDQQLHIRTAFDESSGALIATQYWNSNGGRVAFAASHPRAASWSGDRAAFFGNGSRANPSALHAASLDNRTGAGLDPAAAFQVNITLEPGANAEAVFLLGETESIDAAKRCIGQLNPAEAFLETRRFWNSLLGTIQVTTPSPSADLMINTWLPYQTLSCRFWGRTALYQSSGAFGFRDQLQDAMALVYAAPQIVREHLIRAASRQFLEGDVQHWWHPDTGLGVRTRCSDDLLWLPYAAAHYVEVTGDRAILDLQIPFVEGSSLDSSEQERMFTPSVSPRTATLLEHCRLALQHAWRLGPHELPLIGSGDWNDGLNRVGIKGRGESVWLAWFFGATLKAFAEIDTECRDDYLRQAAQLASTTENIAWDGGWYLRGFFDDGSPLGATSNQEARIDSIAQSWAVLSGMADPRRARIAMDSANRLLVNARDRIIHLFMPPFDHSLPHPGYIMGYPPGVRENGGQYTHAALWLAMARARMGDAPEAVRLLTMLNPVEHARDPESAAQYAGEPYAIAADVSSSSGREGRAGWTWYTGSAAWMYRVWIEEVLGFKLRGEVLTIEPVIPADWPGFSITYRYRSTTYEIEVARGAEVSNTIRLIDDGRTHKINVKIATKELREVKASQPAALNGHAKPYPVKT